MATAQRRSRYGVVIIAMGTLVVFGALGLARFGYSLLLPAMQEGLGLDNTQAGALASANLVGYLALSVIGGALASRYGPRAVITAGLALTGASMLLTGLARDFAAAALWRALAGVGSGGEQRARYGPARRVVSPQTPGPGRGRRRVRIVAGADPAWTRRASHPGLRRRRRLAILLVRVWRGRPRVVLSAAWRSCAIARASRRPRRLARSRETRRAPRARGSHGAMSIDRPRCGGSG